MTDERHTCIYRHFTSEGHLLYVGLSKSPFDRQGAHKSTADWFKQIVRIEIEWFPSYLAAVDAERRAIRDENPRFNKVRYRRPWPARKYEPTGGPVGRPSIYKSRAEKQRAYRKRKMARWLISNAEAPRIS